MSDESPGTPSLRRRLGFTALVSVVLLLGVEGLARALESSVLPFERHLPVAAPIVGLGDFPEIRAAVERLGDERPDWGTRIPLAEDPNLGWALAPNADFRSGGVDIRSDERGLRASDLPRFADDELRLLSLGDSSVFGTGVEAEEVFLSVARSVLARAWGRPVVAVNGGVPGFSSTQSLELGRQLVPAARPTWVVVANLWSDVYRRPESYRDQDRAALASARSALRHSAAYRALWRLLTPVLTARKVGYIDARDDIGEVGTARPCRVALPDYAANLAAIADLCAQLGARVAFLILPAPMDQDAVPPPHAVQEFRATLRRVAGERQAPLLDGPALFAASDAGLALFDDHVHPSVEGHLLLGVGLADLLKDLPPRSL